MRHVPSPNHDHRHGGGPVDMVVLHYTEMTSAEAAIRWLCNPASRVSAHYLIAADGAITAMVDEGRRAWHAGVSGWDGSSDVNSRSIGIELDSPGHTPDPPDFGAAQIAALIDLLAGIRARWPVPARNVVAHSDVAPLRKIDPGERFPWARLADAGHALHVEAQPGAGGCEAEELRAVLRSAGYSLPGEGGMDPLFEATVAAFHRRFLTDRVGAPADAATLATARAFAAAVAVDRLRHPGPFRTAGAPELS